ncbi:hypothetical protein FRX31_009229 [Thalictrum thalictroides]|uniref:Uncharacterized protein n=1 Tax=Thalictrum thalictroides TaxID=46969 RepID=A0A7J6WUT2_THATH|nr:hypothetical protein FRX31_009229 [Thalictrum thalictroides]
MEATIIPFYSKPPITPPSFYPPQPQTQSLTIPDQQELDSVLQSLLNPAIALHLVNHGVLNSEILNFVTIPNQMQQFLKYLCLLTSHPQPQF